MTASSANAAPGSNATYSVKDFLRAQVERHWYWDRRRLAAAGDWAVSIHLLLNRDGSVAKAEIVDDVSHGGNPEYHDLALSARNAVLLSSPFNLPPGLYVVRAGAATLPVAAGGFLIGAVARADVERALRARRQPAGAPIPSIRAVA